MVIAFTSWHYVFENILNFDQISQLAAALSAVTKLSVLRCSKFVSPPSPKNNSAGAVGWD